MTKRLTPEEDARAIEGETNTGNVIAEYNTRGERVVCIDKRIHEMVIEREGERFLEVRFKRRESVQASANQGFTNGQSPVIGGWASAVGAGGVALGYPATAEKPCNCEICQRNRAINSQGSRPVEVSFRVEPANLKFAGSAQEEFFRSHASYVSSTEPGADCPCPACRRLFPNV